MYPSFINDHVVHACTPILLQKKKAKKENKKKKKNLPGSFNLIIITFN